MINVIIPVYLKFIVYLIAFVYAIDYLTHWKKSIFNMKEISDPEHLKFIAKFGKGIDFGIRVFVVFTICILLPLQFKVALDIPYAIQGKFIESKVVVSEDVYDSGNESEHIVKVRDIVSGDVFAIIVTTSTLKTGDRIIIRYLPNSKYALINSIF